MTQTLSEKQNRYRQLGLESVYLAACALQDRVPVLPADVDMQALYKFCKFHSITACVAMALDKAWALNPGDPTVMKQWREARDKAIRKNILLNAERERILAHLESIGCWYMPLKGSLLQYDYPQIGMRQMNDNDILFDAAFQEDINEYMLSQGYEAVVYGKGNHDEYARKPVYNMEMHHSLFMASTSPVLFAYYQDIRSRMRRDSDNQFGYHLSPEDFYIYLTAHAYKHYLHSGVGLRVLLDTYVFVSRHGQSLDWSYISHELEKIGANGFESECRDLAELLFSCPNRDVIVTEDQMGSLDLYLSSGTFGTKQTVAQNALRGDNGESASSRKRRYLLQRLFPPVLYMIEMEPWLDKKRWLIPFAYIRRLFRGFVRRPKEIFQEFSLIKQGKKDK